MKVYFLTLGCRVNRYETDAMRRLFLDKGFEVTENAAEADCCVVNTCSVTGEADRKSHQMLRKMARLNPDAVVVATGCSAELSDGVLDCDLIVGNREKNNIADRVLEYLKKQEEHAHTASHVRPEVTKKDEYHDFGSVLSPEGTRAFMKVEDGCNNFCTYCAIPYARGRVASRSFESCVAEAEFLAASGYKEITVSGIHLCSYGKDRGEDIMSLLRLLQAIDSIPGVERLGLGSLEPMSMTEGFIDGLAGLKHLCPHFHLSLQSGSDTVLKRMNRKYDTAQYADRVSMLRSRFPDMSLTTDIITGFPGETEAEFEETCDFARNTAFAKIHVFPYSEREGTVAAAMPQMDMSVRKARAAELIRISDELAADFAACMTGKTAEVLVETAEGGVPEGYTANYVRTKVDAGADSAQIKPGDIVKGTITGSEGPFCLMDLRFK
ncbi:MAG: tRNA (N(6)-L-threonylcarbamoyladenosine(37)-C(2))-methylthiotransferase MtaB [Clostridiales bacterium]|nr:tRNA (N(6)-L-threonylcarbamoyladenosine(37)-C(2))-methylthiotransferase MtaB [Clostridiales bacterium]